MPMRDLPVSLEGYRLTVTEAPEPKLRELDGAEVEAIDRATGARLFTVSLFAKLRTPGPSGRREKGEEIKVTLETDPGDGFEEGTPVGLVDVRVSPYLIENGGRTNAGISFRARGLSPAGAGTPSKTSRALAGQTGGNGGTGDESKDAA